MSESRYLFVYILKCSVNTYYTGFTYNPERRIEEHNSGDNKNSYTSQRLPIEMIFCEKFTDFNLAIIWEKKIKDWSRKKKEALIKENWDQLKIEAACKNYTSHKNLVGQASSVLDSARTETQESLSAQTITVRSQSHFTIVDTNA